MGLWGYIIAHTQNSPGRLLVFGGLLTAATYVLGSTFAGLTAADVDVKKRKAMMDELPYDNRVSGELAEHWKHAPCASYPSRIAVVGVL